MSHYCDEHYDEYTEVQTTDSLVHTCDACQEKILAGTTYWSVFWEFDGSEHTVKRCERCQAIHLHLREIGSIHEMWPDEKLACGKTYEGEWGALPPSIAALAFALPSEGTSFYKEVP